ncbi:MAG: hydroxymethylbilane synthase [Actinobacteria bacterium]|nr:hydroxymethylbilane synthase [Actinomycetota bacterium]
MDGAAPLRIGTRRSALAIAQAREVAGRLEAAGFASELVPMSTSGDRGASVSRSPQGLKGLFVAEIVRALQNGEVDLAVHSAKDLPAEDPEGVVVAAVPERASPLDVLVRRTPEPLGEGTAVGTSSLRRRGQLARARPGVRLVDVRGNVDTRLRKLRDGEVDGLVLAAAGLARLGIEVEHAEELGVAEMVPAPGQGALAVQARAGSESAGWAARIDHGPSHAAFEAERLVMDLVGGGCALPLGAYAEVADGEVWLRAVVLSPDGARRVGAQARASTPEEAGHRVASRLKRGGADAILAEVYG